MPKKLIVLFDGTWNTPDLQPEIDGNTSTNVAKLHDAILDEDSNGIAQKKWYETGVGTKWYNKIKGGAFGVGLSKKIQEGYEFLVKNFEKDDEVFIFGFSRGAYSARSLVGLIRNAGLLKREYVKFIPNAYSLYRTRDEGADSENALFFRKEYSQDIPIKFLGVWDTVGALGIPLESFEWFNKRYYQFHDTELSGIVKNAFHALAIDEHRENYSPALWDPKSKPNQRLEQVWFVGAHSNIGGGYADNTLSDVALKWMADRAKDCGLGLDPNKIPKADRSDSEVVDSYERFMGGLYKKIRLRYYRDIGSTQYGNEMLHLSVKQRVESDLNYKPKNKIKSSLQGDFTPADRIIKPHE